MSHRAPSSQRRMLSATDNNPYQPTTTSLQPTHYVNQHPYNPAYRNSTRESHKHRNSYRKAYHNAATVESGLSDPTFTENDSYYDYYYQDQRGHPRNHKSRPRDSREYSFSDDSGSIRLPLYDNDDDSTRRFSRNTFSERSFVRPHQYLENAPSHHQSGIRDLRKVYPNQPDVGWDRLYQEIPTPCEDGHTSASSTRRNAASRLSDRPQSSMSSAVTTSVVDGCGGRCQTCENVCYFFLQLVFTMGIFIGTSLCLAAAALRKSAARNIQVLVYIGVLITLVCSLLLAIQCNARHNATKRKKAIKLAKQRAPIPLETLHPRSGVNTASTSQVEQPLMQDGNQRPPVPQTLPQVHSIINRPLPHRPQSSSSPTLIEEPGIPWWRRKDLKH